MNQGKLGQGGRGYGIFDEFLLSHFFEVRTFCFLNKVRFPTLLPEPAGAFLKIEYESGIFAARRIGRSLLLKVAL